jgi:hypothetical protein
MAAISAPKIPTSLPPGHAGVRVGGDLNSTCEDVNRITYGLTGLEDVAKSSTPGTLTGFVAWGHAAAGMPAELRTRNQGPPRFAITEAEATRLGVPRLQGADGDALAPAVLAAAEWLLSTRTGGAPAQSTRPTAGPTAPFLRAALGLAFSEPVPAAPTRAWVVVRVSRLSPPALTELAALVGASYVAPAGSVSVVAAGTALAAASSAAVRARAEHVAATEALAMAAAATAAAERRLSLRPGAAAAPQADPQDQAVATSEAAALVAARDAARAAEVAAASAADEADGRANAAAGAAALAEQVRAVAAAAADDDLIARDEIVAALVGGLSPAGGEAPTREQALTYKGSLEIVKREAELRATAADIAGAGIDGTGDYRWPLLRKAMQETGQFPTVALTPTQAMTVVPLALPAIHSALVAQATGYLLFVQAVENHPVACDRMRWLDALEDSDALAAALVMPPDGSPGIPVDLSPLERVMHLIPVAVVAKLVLGEKYLDFGSRTDEAAATLRACFEAVTFVSTDGQSLVLAPGATHLSLGLREAARGRLAYRDNRSLISLVLCKLTAALELGRDFQVHAAERGAAAVPSFQRGSRDLVAYMAGLAPGDRVPDAKLDELVSWLGALGRAEAHETAQTRRVDAAGAAVREARVAGVRAALELPGALGLAPPAGPAVVGGVRSIACSLTAGCTGMWRRSDPMCPACHKFVAAAWKCPKCLAFSVRDDCFNYYCVTRRPTRGLVRPTGGDVSHVLAMYERRMKHEQHK